MSIPSGKPAHDTNPLDRLDEIQARAEAGTGPGCAACGFPDENADGKWWRCTICANDEYELDVPTWADAEKLALVAALRAVLKFADLCDAEDQVFQAWVVRDALRVQITDALGEAQP